MLFVGASYGGRECAGGKRRIAWTASTNSELSANIYGKARLKGISSYY